MSSKNIYTEQTIPYFYIIRHIPSQKLYAGSRWAKGCNPLEFMQLNGYTTSSTKINSIINLEGLDSFEILRIDTNCDGLHPRDYETLFLQCNDCASSDNWFNGHNNSMTMVFGTEIFKQKSKETCLQKYGYENPLQIPEIREKIKTTNYNLYGYMYPQQSPIIRENTKETCLGKYGYEYTLQVPEIREKSKQTMLNTYGVDNISKAPEIKQKKSDTCFRNYGVDNPSKSKKIKQKKIDTCLNHYGVDNISKVPEIKQKKSDTALDKWGVEHTLQSPIIKDKIKQTLIDLYGYDNPAKTPFLCIIENKKSYAKNTLSRWYPEFKMFY
jgi:hypothetical protein